MSESPPEFPVPGHQVPPTGPDSTHPHRPHSTYGRSPVRAKPVSHAESSEAGAHSASALGTEHSQADDEISLLDIAIVLVKHKRLIIGSPFLAAVITAGITLLMPNWYTATAKILPPQQGQSNAVAILGQLGALAGGAGPALGVKNPNDVFVAMLKSRTVADSIIGRFKLKEIYDEQYMQDARKELTKNVGITSGRDSVITIEVEDKNPQRAADMANAYVEELEKLTLRLAVGEAGQRRLFFEKQLKQAKDDLSQAETDLATFQVEKKILNPQSQASLAIAASAGLQAQIAAKEVQIVALKSFATSENPDLLRAQEELGGLRTQLAKVGRGRADESGDVLLSMGKAPAVGVEFLRKFREVKYFETLFELLAKQYEVAKIDESKSATLVQVLDTALAPEKKSKPKRALIVVITLVLSFIASLFFVFIREKWLVVEKRKLNEAS